MSNYRRNIMRVGMCRISIFVAALVGYSNKLGIDITVIVMVFAIIGVIVFSIRAEYWKDREGE